MAQSNVNQAKKLTAVFTDINGAAVNPGSITLSIYREWQGVVTLVATKVKTDMVNEVNPGTWYCLFTPGANGPGRYTGRWVTDNGVDQEESWDVSAGTVVT